MSKQIKNNGQYTLYYSDPRPSKDAEFLTNVMVDRTMANEDLSLWEIEDL